MLLKPVALHDDKDKLAQALRESTERFELVGRATNDVVWDWDLLTYSLWWNSNFQALFGYKAEDIEPGIESWTNRVHSDDVQRVVASIYLVIDGGGEHWEAEYRFRRADGSYARIFDRGYVLHDDSGTPIRMIGAMMDLTARKEAEERFEQLTQHINEVFWLKDTATHQLLYVSPAYETIWGGPIDTLLKSADAWLHAVHEEDKSRVARAVATKQTLGSYDEEYRIVRPDGDQRWIREKAFPITDAAGSVYRVAGVAADVTAYKKMEEEFRHAQKMEAVGQLSGGVAHDFNNILTVIQGNAALLNSQSLSDQEVREYAAEINSAAERGANLTRQLLLFSRKQKIQPADVDANEIARGIIKMLERIVGEDVQLITELAADLPLIKADTGMIEQVLLNLVVNARDAMPAGGTIIIRTALIDDETNIKEIVRMSVSDTGVGIPPRIRPRIFEPFFTTKEQGKGTGLGLATVYGIMEQHRGMIEVRSEEGRGTTFHILFPSAGYGVADAPLPSAVPPHGHARGEGTILVVEDEFAVRRLIVRHLERNGYTVLQAESGIEAIDVWNNNHQSIDLLLTDLVMPGGINGRELATRMHADQPDLPVVYTSGYTADVIPFGELLIEGVNFIEKPFSLDALTAVISARLSLYEH